MPSKSIAEFEIKVIPCAPLPTGYTIPRAAFKYTGNYSLRFGKTTKIFIDKTRSSETKSKTYNICRDISLVEFLDLYDKAINNGGEYGEDEQTQNYYSKILRVTKPFSKADYEEIMLQCVINSI